MAFAFKIRPEKLRHRSSAAVLGGGCGRRPAASSFTGRDARSTRRRDADATMCRRPIGSPRAPPASRRSAGRIFRNVHANARSARAFYGNAARRPRRPRPRSRAACRRAENSPRPRGTSERRSGTVRQLWRKALRRCRKAPRPPGNKSRRSRNPFRRSRTPLRHLRTFRRHSRTPRRPDGTSFRH